MIRSMFDFPAAIRKATDTTNSIETVHSVIRKFTRSRKQNQNRESAMKLSFIEQKRMPQSAVVDGGSEFIIKNQATKNDNRTSLSFSGIPGHSSPYAALSKAVTGD
jgi:transposase-like protein